MDPIELGGFVPVYVSPLVPPGQAFVFNIDAFAQSVGVLSGVIAQSKADIAALANLMLAGEGVEWKGDPIDGSSLCRS